VLVAFVLTALIGLERELQGKSAGLAMTLSGVRVPDASACLPT
jgi:uncharacterized membrane protein YhiD involved in acid resistance